MRTYKACIQAVDNLRDKKTPPKSCHTKRILGFNVNLNTLTSIVSDENDKQMLRLIQQYLTERGHEDLAKELSLRTKVRMEEEVVNDFR